MPLTETPQKIDCLLQRKQSRLAHQYPLSRSASGLAGFLMHVCRFEVLIEHLLHQASVFLYVPENDKGHLWTTRANASQKWISTWARSDYQFRILHAHSSHRSWQSCQSYNYCRLRFIFPCLLKLIWSTFS
jgi:hypothetical protein